MEACFCFLCLCGRSVQIQIFLWEILPIGSVTAARVLYPTAPIKGRHTILNKDSLHQQGNLYDERCNVIEKVPYLFQFACKIGNDSAGAKIDAIEYEMIVDTNNALLVLAYVLVAQLPFSIFQFHIV